MERIIYVGMDVHKSGYALCCLEPRLIGEDNYFGEHKVEASASAVKQYLVRMKKKLSESPGLQTRYVCAYEAGYCGYALQRELTNMGIDCVILAPSKISKAPGDKIKTDKRDARLIARSLAYDTGHKVHVPTEQDESVRRYMRLRDDVRIMLSQIKKQIHSFCAMLGAYYPTNLSYWTAAHLKWLNDLELTIVDRETLDEYLINYRFNNDRLDAFDRRIEEFAAEDAYRERVKKLTCFLGIRTHTALTVLVEVGDFYRFKGAEPFASYLGLVPGESSSGKKLTRTGITKAGNSHVRRLLTESSQSICRGLVGHKSLALKKRQEGNASNVIAYADRANIRLRQKYYRLIHKGKRRNVAITSVARELACFIWGMMTDNLNKWQPA